MLPMLLGGLGAIYSIGNAIDNYRYWSEYRKNTGYSPRYPFRSGMYDSMLYASFVPTSFSKLKRL